MREEFVVIEQDKIKPMAWSFQTLEVAQDFITCLSGYRRPNKIPKDINFIRVLYPNE